MNDPDQADGSTFAGKRAGLWRITTVLAVATAGLIALSIVLDAGSGRARDLALLIGAPTLYVLLPATVVCFVVALVLRIRRRRIDLRRRKG